MSNELKPCPFCGNKIEVLQYNFRGEDSRNGKWVIYLSEHNEQCSLKSFGKYYYHTEQDAIDDWNNRV